MYTGEIPFSLFNITSLRDMDFDKNNLNGNLPSEMCQQLPQLQMFTVMFNHFGGSIPRSIGNCTSLLVLGLQHNFWYTRPQFYVYFFYFEKPNGKTNMHKLSDIVDFYNLGYSFKCVYNILYSSLNNCCLRFIHSY